MELLGVFETLLLPLSVALLTIVLLFVHFTLKRQFQQRHEELMQTLAAQQNSIAQTLHSAFEQKFPVAALPEAKAGKSEAKITEDKLMVIGAVLACHFGKRVKVRSARRVTVGGGSNVWSQQGRAAVQASHSGFR